MYISWKKYLWANDVCILHGVIFDWNREYQQNEIGSVHLSLQALVFRTSFAKEQESCFMLFLHRKMDLIHPNTIGDQTALPAPCQHIQTKCSSNPLLLWHFQLKATCLMFGEVFGIPVTKKRCFAGEHWADWSSQMSNPIKFGVSDLVVLYGS